MPTYPLVREASSLCVKVGVAPAKIYAGKANPPQTYHAVIDTCAEVSVISPSVIKAMMVPDLGRTPVLLSGGKISFDSTYDVLLRLGGHETSGPWYPRVVTGTIPATPGVDVVIGMDLLIGLKFGWDGITGSGTGSITDRY
jgi:predicted aspartyl protease